MINKPKHIRFTMSNIDPGFNWLFLYSIFIYLGLTL